MDNFLNHKSLLLIILFMALGAVVSLFSSPLFEIKNINFLGDELNNKAKIKQALADIYGENIFFLQEAQLEAKLAYNPYISNLELNKKYPRTINLEIDKRTAVGWIKNRGQALIFADDGYILKRKESLDINLPEIVGFGYKFKQDNLVFPENLEKIIKGITYLTPTEKSYISQITSCNDGQTNVKLVSGTSVLLGGIDEIDQKFRLLNSIIKNNKEHLSEVSYIDLRLIQKPVIKIKK